LLTVNRQVDPRSVVRVVSGGRAVMEEHDGTLVPACVRRPQIRYLDGRLLHEPDTTLVAGSDVWGIAVELDEHGHLQPRKDNR